jgi:hypothetical protein
MPALRVPRFRLWPPNSRSAKPAARHKPERYDRLNGWSGRRSRSRAGQGASGAACGGAQNRRTPPLRRSPGHRASARAHELGTAQSCRRAEAPAPRWSATLAAFQGYLVALIGGSSFAQLDCGQLRGRNAPVKPTSSSAQSRRPRRSSGIGPAARAKLLASRRVLLRVRRVAANACHGLGNVGGVGRGGEAGGPVQQADCEKADAGCLLPLPPGTSVNRTSASTKKFSGAAHGQVSREPILQRLPEPPGD